MKELTLKQQYIRGAILLERFSPDGKWKRCEGKTFLCNKLRQEIIEIIEAFNKQFADEGSPIHIQED